MISCPSCKRSLADWAKNCQFCGADVTKVARPVEVPKSKYPVRAISPWVVGLYYTFAALWIVDGLRVILVSMQVVGAALGAGSPFASIGIVGAVFGVLFILIGIGLMVQNELARGVVNVLLWLRLGWGILALIMTIFIAPMAGLMGFAEIGFALFNVVWAGAQIWTIAETQRAYK